MLQTVLDANPAGETSTARELTLAAYRFMLKARVLDDKYAALYRAGKIHGGVFLGRGQEALSVAVGLSLKKTDVFAPLIRDAAGRLAFGETILDAIRTYLGSPLGPMRGRDGNVHRGKPQEGYLPMVSHLGAMISVVNGTLFARRMKGVTGTVGATCPLSCTTTLPLPAATPPTWPGTTSVKRATVIVNCRREGVRSSTTTGWVPFLP